MSTELSRRRFLIAGAVTTGGLLVGCVAPEPHERLGKPADFPAQGDQVSLNAWVKISPDGTVTVAVPRAEMGQGVMTSLPMLLAEELDARWDDVRVEPAPIAQIYANEAAMLNALPFGIGDEGWLARAATGLVQRTGRVLHLQITGGSSSIRDAWLPLRVVGATARAMLVEAAARRWQVGAADCRTEAGHVVHAASGRKLGYGVLATDAAKLAPPSDVPVKSPDQFKLIGKAAARKDIPAKVNGSAQFGVDVRLPGMLYAAPVQAPVFGADVASFDATEVLRLRGVKQVVQIPHAVVVVADSWWRAKQAAAQLKVTWTATPFDQTSSADIARGADEALAQQSGTSFTNRGDAEGALKEAEAAARAGGAKQRVLQARYHAPYLAHAAMEPINCTAQVKDGEVTVWASTQVASLAKWRASQIAGVDSERVTVHLPLLGGGFGRRLEVDMVEQAVAVAMQVSGQPVKLLWTREDDTRHDLYRPAAWADFRAVLDDKGQALAWHNRVAAQSTTYGATQRLLPWAAADSPDKAQIEGAFDLPYDIPNLAVRQVRLKGHVPVGAWRSVGHSYNAFFVESFADELAHAAGQDPFAWRRSRLGAHPRHLAVLDRAAKEAGWGQPLPAGRARGIALQESFGSICAQVAEVSVEAGQVRVHRVVCAIDCGVVVNPDTVEAQMQGSIVFGLSAALHGEITLAQGRVRQANYTDYPMVKLAQMPRIDVHILRNAHAPGGVGEPGVPPLAPAVANAVFTLTGQRLRSLPLRLPTTA
jgi:isoquinoline 1-oxidoreductase beta subunit